MKTTQRISPQTKAIIQAAADTYGVSYKDVMTGKKRPVTNDAAKARSVACYLLAKYTPIQRKQISVILGMHKDYFYKVQWRMRKSVKAGNDALSENIRYAKTLIVEREIVEGAELEIKDSQRLDAILDAACAHFNITAEEAKCKRMFKNMVLARRWYCYMAYEKMPNVSYTTIGKKIKRKSNCVWGHIEAVKSMKASKAKPTIDKLTKAINKAIKQKNNRTK